MTYEEYEQKCGEFAQEMQLIWMSSGRICLMQD
jgi:hypothetical protein